MQVLNKQSGEPFTDQDLQLLTTLAAQAAVAVENARLVRSLKEERDKLLAKEAEVRAAIARDLHDGPTQSVAAIAMNIEFVKRLMRAMPERVESELNVLSELVQKTAYDIRTLLFELRPLGLETQGLLSTLQQYVNRFRDPTGADASCAWRRHRASRACRSRSRARSLSSFRRRSTTRASTRARPRW